MSLWSGLFTLAVPVRRYGGRNSCGDPVYAPAETIFCRVEFRRSLAINETGEQVASNIRLFSETELLPGSLAEIRGKEWPVISTAEAVDLHGNVDHYEMRL